MRFSTRRGTPGWKPPSLYALFARAMGHQNLPQSSNMCPETTSVDLQTFIGTPVGNLHAGGFRPLRLDLFLRCGAIPMFRSAHRGCGGKIRAYAGRQAAPDVRYRST